MLHASSGFSPGELPYPPGDAVAVMLVATAVLGIIAYDAYRYHWGG